MNIEDELKKITSLVDDLKKSTENSLKLAEENMKAIEDKNIKDFLAGSMKQAKEGSLNLSFFAKKVNELINK